MQRHRHQEFIRFLNALERDVPADKTVHVILDTYCIQKHGKVQAWLQRHPRWTFHFIPTSTSWLNAVEGVFAKLTRRRLKHGVFRSVGDLQDAISRFIAEHNHTEAKPFVWRADPDQIIAARNRGFQKLDSIHWSTVEPEISTGRKTQLPSGAPGVSPVAGEKRGAFNHLKIRLAFIA